jgi:anti-sigma factor RsiW
MKSYEGVIMDSSHTLAPSDEELLSMAYDEGALPEEKKEHFEQCDLCQQRLATYKRTNSRLLSKLYRSACPSAVDLNYYCLGVVSKEERVSIASHLLECPACTDDVAEIRRTQAAFEPFPPAAFSLRTAVRRLFATLVVQQAQPVTRDMAPSTGWPRQYRTETIDLSLHLSRAANGEIMLLGIITSTDADMTVEAFEGTEVDLYSAPGSLAEVAQASDEAPTPFLTAEVDDVGNILLEPVPAGNYAMVVRLPDLEVVIEGLNID